MKQGHRCSICNKHLYMKHTYWWMTRFVYMHDGIIFVGGIYPRCEKHANTSPKP